MLIFKVLYAKLLEFDTESDPRTVDVPEASFTYTFVLVGLYLLVVHKLGPAFMLKRKPYEVKRIVQIYNIMQVILNAFIFAQVWRFGSMCIIPNLICLVLILTRQITVHISSSIFFVLRKKWKQVSFLHVYHHCLMLICACIYLKYLLGSHFEIVGLINCFVHVVMYSYYFVSSLNLAVNLQPWKRRVTQLQIVQFFFYTVHLGRALFNNWCGLSPFWLIASFMQNAFITVLFFNFYYRTYLAKPKRNE
uniref:Elongation of very long chain fatty acids protein n=1 Tax=Glossina brevipalpis TaxID=37001 RepID=A0A1A9WA14_9MUSC